MQKKLLVLSLIFGCILILGALCLSIIFRFTVGNAIALLFGIFLVGLYFVYPKLSKTLRLCLKTIICCVGVFFIVMVTIIVINGKKSTTTFKEDSVLVLGSGIRGDVVLSTLQLRLDKCLEYIQHNPDVVIVVSGGQGRGEDISEAEAMRRYLIQQNVDSTLIIKEDKSRDTRDNMQYSKVILDSCFTVLGKQNYTTVCITSDFHAYRSSLLAKRFGLNTTSYNSKVKWYMRPSTYCREVLSICKFWFLS